MHEIIQQYTVKWDAAMEHFQKDLKSLRSNRANPAAIADVSVSYYETPTPLSQIATVTTPEPRQMMIEAWDKEVLKDIEAALEALDNGYSITNDGSSIRVTLPDMSEDVRKQTVTLLHKKSEDARISVRKIREDVLKTAKTQKESGDLSEDDLFKIQKEVQDEVDKFNGIIKSDSEKKENEIMTI